MIRTPSGHSSTAHRAGADRRDDHLRPEALPDDIPGRRGGVMAVTLAPPPRRDEAWVSREVHRARALLIMAAVHGQPVRYGELSPFGHLHWYANRRRGQRKRYRDLGAEHQC